jgi:hypothetical protein
MRFREGRQKTLSYVRRPKLEVLLARTMAADASDAIAFNDPDVFAKRACVESAIIMRSNLTVASWIDM